MSQILPSLQGQHSQLCLLELQPAQYSRHSAAAAKLQIAAFAPEGWTQQPWRTPAIAWQKA